MMNVQGAVEKLNSLLPLKARQDQLPASLKSLHKSILFSLVEQGRAPTHHEMASLVGNENIDKALQRLGSDDLVVLGPDANLPLGAYPITVEKTPHKITVNGHTIHAMCALDAISVAPMFNTQVVIESECHVTHAPIQIHMQGEVISQSMPSTDIMIGIRWQTPSSVAAHSLCMEMFFLSDKQIAEKWKNEDNVNISLFTLTEALGFGNAFFLPLVE